MEKSRSFNDRSQEIDLQNSWNADLGLSTSDRRLAFSRQSSFQQSHQDSSSHDVTKPFLSRTMSSIDIPPGISLNDKFSSEPDKFSIFRAVRYGNRQIKRLFLMISLNVAYSTIEMAIGLFTGRVGLVSDAFHLTFGCGLLTFSIFAMAVSRKKPDLVYTYGYKRLEVMSAFTNALFLLFMSFSLAVEALHAFIQDESEHKHYLIVSAVTNLLVNLIGVWFFRNYARINLDSSECEEIIAWFFRIRENGRLSPHNMSVWIVVALACISSRDALHRRAEDMNYHSVCLHVLADSIRSAGLILASWFLSLGVKNAEVLCLGLVSVAVFMLVMPLFKTTGGVLLQMAPPSIPSSALTKCLRQITSREDVTEVSQARFWELVPGHVVGSISLQVKKGTDDRPVLEYVHGLYHDLGIQDLTVQIDYDLG